MTLPPSRSLPTLVCAALELEVSDTRFLDSIRLTRRYVAFRVYRSQGWLSPVLLVDGRMEGLWRHDRKGGRLIVEIEPFATQPEWVRREAEEVAERLARFLGGDLELVWSSS